MLGQCPGIVKQIVDVVVFERLGEGNGLKELEFVARLDELTEISVGFQVVVGECVVYIDDGQ